MPNIKVKQLDSRIATQGVHFGMGPETRKLEPGEIVYIDEKSNVFEAIYATGTVEITVEKPNRPLTFKDAREARYCSPTFRPRDAAEVMAVELARIEVAKRVELSERNRPGQIAATKKAAEKRKETVETEAPPQKVDNRRARRKQILEEQARGEANTA
jgi:hypothetical protein